MSASRYGLMKEASRAKVTKPDQAQPPKPDSSAGLKAGPGKPTVTKPDRVQPLMSDQFMTLPEFKLFLDDTDLPESFRSDISSLVERKGIDTVVDFEEEFVRLNPEFAEYLARRRAQNMGGA